MPICNPFEAYTIPSNLVPSIANTRSRKQSKENYSALVSDLESTGYKADLLTFEIGSLGHFNRESINAIQAILPELTRRIASDLLSLSKIAITFSKLIFEARLGEMWNTRLVVLNLFPIHPLYDSATFLVILCTFS